MTEQEILSRVYEYVAARYNDGDASFTVDDGLLEHGIIDSQGLLDLITYLETEFSIVIDDDEVDLVNFATINTVGRFVTTKIS